MATISLTTSAGAQGTYNDLPMSLTAEAPAVVSLEVDGVTLTFVPDSPTWDTANPMGYTLTITNATALPFVAPIAVTTDAYPTSLVTVDNTSVQLNGGTTGFTSHVTDGVLTVNLEDDVESTAAVITFQVNKN